MKPTSTIRWPSPLNHSHSNRRQSGRRPSVAAMIEAMEGRRLMDATSPFNVNGTNGNDVITLQYNPPPVLAQAVTANSTPSPTTTTTTSPFVSAAAMTTMTTTATASPTPTSTPTTTATSFYAGTSTLPGTVYYNTNLLQITINGVTSTATVLPSQRIVVNGMDGNDTIRVYGTHGVDIFAGNGNDVMSGGSGPDSFYGGPGTDTVDYSARNAGVSVTLEGLNNDGAPGEGDNVATDNEIVQGGWGNDTLADAGGFTGVQLYGNWGDDTITGSLADDYIDGGPGNDTIHGNWGNDVIHGGAGDDVLFGDENNDSIYGDDGNDRLYGGLGDDNLHGGNGDDVLVTLGGGQHDVSWGDSGFDNFWADSESTEVVNVEPSEIARNVHKVSQFMALNVGGVNYGSPSRELNGQAIVDPTNADGFANVPMPGVPLFGPGGPSPNEIHQGVLGDCYYLAALSAVAKVSPEVIRQSIVDLGDGTYGVHFYNKDKSSVFIRMDGDLPTNSSGNLAYDSIGVPGGGLWGPLLEKAWAYFRKGNGSYWQIAAGWPEHGYQALGLNTTIKDRSIYNTPTKMLQAITEEQNAGDAVAMYTNPGGTLLGDHIYMVDRWYTDAAGTRWVVMRNPWGADGPGGDAVNDGYITMTAEEVFNSFNQVAGGHV